MKNFFRPMALLLKYDGYPPGVVVALLLHGFILYLLLDRTIVPREQVNVERPTYINATVIRENPQEAARQRQVETQRQAAADRRREEQQREAEAERQRQAEQQRQREAEAERQRQAEQQRQREAEAERQRQAAEQQRQREAAARAAEEQAATQAQAEGAYSAIIHDTVRNSWNIPPSARNGMSVLLQINLVPTGEVISVNVLESSGDAAFDRSAVQAVRRADRFPELQDMPIGLFERRFRQFNLLFRPEGLLRDQ